MVDEEVVEAAAASGAGAVEQAAMAAAGETAQEEAEGLTRSVTHQSDCPLGKGKLTVVLAVDLSTQRQRIDKGPSGGGGGHGQGFAHQQQGYLRGASQPSLLTCRALDANNSTMPGADSFFEDPWAKLLATRPAKI